MSPPNALILSVETPPGLPWAQQQVARLEAEHRSPVQGQDIQVLLLRRSPWRMGQPGLFHAAIVRGDALDPRADSLDLPFQGETLRFPIGRAGGLATLAPLALVTGLTAATAGLALVTVWSALHPDVSAQLPPAARRDPGAGQPHNLQMVEDLIAVRDAFGSGQTLKAVRWSPAETIVETAPSDAANATGAGRAFEKLPRDPNAGVDRWRLPAAPPAAGPPR